MKNLLLIQCLACKRFRKFGQWVALDQLQSPEKENLSWLIITDAVDYQFELCPECKDQCG